MTGLSSARFRAMVLASLPSLVAAQTASPGRVNYIENAKANFDQYTAAPNLAQQQWLQNHFAAMVVYEPYFDSRLSWFPNAYAYSDFYGIAKGSWEENVHPEWIARDQYGNWLYIPYNCGGGTCAMYAADISNPAFRAAWINNVRGLWQYQGLCIDDVNLEFRVSDGSGNPVAPVDFNTGKPMTYDAWRNYMATYLEEVKAAVPNMKIMENAIWYAGPAGTTPGTDMQVQRQIATADIVSLERGVASDAGLMGGTGFWSVYSFFGYIDRIHAAGKGVSLQEYSLDAGGLEYGLASYFLISTGKDSIGDTGTTPNNWWSGYDVDLGTPLGPRSYSNGIFERDFTKGKVLLGEPGLSTQTVSLGGTFTRLDGTPVTSISIGGAQGAVLLGNGPASPVNGPASPVNGPASPVNGPASPVNGPPSPVNDPPTQVLNAASLSAGPVSPGEIVTLFAAFSAAPSGVTVNGIAAPILSSDSKQVNAVVPFALDLSKAADIQIQAGAANLNTSVPVATASPAIFTQGAAGTGPGAVLNQDYSPNSASNPAASGSVIMIYGTGFGMLNPAPVDGQTAEVPAATQAPVTATINGVAATVVYAGAAPGLVAGVEQINVLVPDGLAANPSAPVVLTIGSQTTQTGVTVAVQ